MLERYPADDPREWMNRARSSLAMAKMKAEGIYLEDLCFSAQQAAEKAIKAVFIKMQIEFPYTHNIAQLLTLLERAGPKIPEFAREAEPLTRYAVLDRYPRMSPPIEHDEYEEAVAVAEQVVRWVEGIIGS